MPSQAQRKRAEGRENRRNNDSDASPENEGSSSEDQTLDAVKQAAKVAAASVAAGAVAAAVRALANRHESSGEQDSGERDSENREQPVQEPEQSAQAEPEEHAEQEQGRAREHEQEQETETEPRPEQEPEQTAEQAPEQAQLREQAQTSVRHEPIEGATSDEAREVVDGAKQQLELLLGKTPEMVSSLERTDDGWLVTVEVVEVSRVPESTDVLASYEIELDDDRNLRRYARVRRYSRSQSDREGMS